MEQSLKSQNNHPNKQAITKNKICSKEVVEVPTRRSLSSFLNPPNNKDKEEEPSVYINLRFRIPVAPFKFVRKHIHGTSSSNKNRAKPEKPLKFPFHVSKVLASNRKVGLKALGFRETERTNESNSKSRPPFSFLGNVSRKAKNRAFEIKPKSAFTFLRNLDSKKTCKKNGKSDLGFPKNNNSDNGLKVLGFQSGDSSNSDRSSSSSKSKQSPEALNGSKSPSSCLIYLDDTNGFKDFDSISSTDSEDYIFELPIPPFSEKGLNIDDENMGGEELEERPSGFPNDSPEKLQDDFDAGKLCFPVKKMLEFAMHRKGGKEELCNKRILMGGKCQPLDFTGVIHYDEHGNPLEKLQAKNKAMAPRLPTPPPPPPPRKGAEGGEMVWGSWRSSRPLLGVKFLA